MNDRKLLEMAAKAAGYEFMKHDSTHWSPLEDDGDAFRLAVKLGMYLNVYISAFGQTFAGVCSTSPSIHELHEDDPCKATRRAIVRAAAEIGRNMK